MMTGLLETQITARLITEEGDIPLYGNPEQIGRAIADACVHDPSAAYSHRLEIIDPAELPSVTQEDLDKIQKQVGDQVLGAAFFLAEAGLGSLSQFGINSSGKSVLEYLSED